MCVDLGDFCDEADTCKRHLASVERVSDKKRANKSKERIAKMLNINTNKKKTLECRSIENQYFDTRGVVCARDGKIRKI